jgi:signal transduction histidine kinase
VAAGENRRRSKVVDRKFQVGMAWRLVLVLTVLFTGSILLMFAPSLYVLLMTKDLSSLEPAAAEFLVLHKRIWPAALICFAGIFVYAFLFSNRIAGPIYRINASLHQLLRGEYPEKIAFREGDFFRPTAELLEKLSGKLAAMEEGKAAGKNVLKGKERGS